MKLLLFPLLLLCTLSSPAQVAMLSYQDAKGLRDQCRELIAGIYGTKTIDGTIGKTTDDTITIGKTPPDPVNAAACVGYIKGAVDGLNLAMATGALPESFKACMPAGHAPDELIRVFVKFIDGHPEELSNGAANIVWNAMNASYPCPAK